MLPLYRQLKQIRKAKRVHLKDLAGQAGMTRAHLSHIEKERIDVRLSNFCALADALNLEVMLIPKSLRGDVALLMLEHSAQPLLVNEQEDNGPC